MEIQPNLVVAGGLHVDEIATLAAGAVEQASNPVFWQRFVGGVASNAARAAQTYYSTAGYGSVTFHCALGNDGAGQNLTTIMRTQDIKVCPQWFDDHATGRYTAVMTHSGELLMGLADVHLAEQLNPSPVLSTMHRDSSDAGTATSLLLDANLSSKCIHNMVKGARNASVKLAALTVSPAKAIRLLPFSAQIDLLFCNRREALALAVASGLMPEDMLAEQPALLELAEALSEVGFVNFVLSDGAAELLTAHKGRYVSHVIAQIPVINNVNGAGDTLAGATFAAVTCGIAVDEAVIAHGIPMAAEVITGKRLPLSL